MPRRSEEVTLGAEVLREWRLPVPEGGKSARGSALVIGGAATNPGAVLLAGVAALRAGAGVLQMAVARSAAAALSIAVPEARVVGLAETGTGSVAGELDDGLAGMVSEAAVVLVGPGLDDVEHTHTLLRRVIASARPGGAVVLDAYALGALSREPELLRDRGGPAVLTPNGAEAGILLGEDPAEDADDGELAARVADRYGAVVCLSGRVAAPDGGRWRERNGHPGLGTSGSGDVLAGIVAGLISRGASAEQAACWGSYAHAVAGQRLVPRYGRLGLLARELVDQVPATIAELQ